MRDLVAKSLVTVGVTFVCLLFCAQPVAAQQASELTSAQKIEQLEKVLQEIKASMADGASEEARLEQLEQEIAALKKEVADETAATDKPKGLSVEQQETVHEKTAAASHVGYSAEWQVGQPKKFVPDKGWIGIPGNNEIKIWGWAQAALFRDFQENLLNNVQEFSAGLVPTPTGDKPTTGLDIASSRIFFQSRHLLKGDNAVKVLWIMDGGGSNPIGGYSPRVRQFNVTINNLTFGKAGGTFANMSAWPAYFDRGAPGGFPLARQGVIRYGIPLNKKDKKKSIFTVGVERKEPSILDLEAAAADPQNFKADTTFNFPDFVARYDWNPKWGNLMWAAIARDFYVDSQSSNQSVEKWGYGLTMSGYATFNKGKGKPKDHLKFSFQGGNGIGAYTWDSGFGPNDGVYVDSTQTLELLDSYGGFMAYEAHWSKKLFSVFMVSYVKVDNIDLQPVEVFSNTTTYIGTLMWSPWENTMFMGFEYFYGVRENKAGQTGRDNRLNLVFRYIFNR